MSKESRSFTMSRIRSKGNASTEMKMVELLRKNQITGWRRQFNLPGRPDFVFPKKRLALFIDGCFWHGCPKCKLIPKTNIEYWAKKIRGNRERDKTIKKQLEQKRWTVIRIWEHQLENSQWTVRKIRKALMIQ